MEATITYKDQDSPLTLAEGLAQYGRENPDLIDASIVSAEAARFFRGHDACHVVFGCGIAPDEEALADAWTLLGTDVTLRQFLGFLKLEEHKDIVQQVGLVGACVASARACPRLLKALWWSHKMTRQWPWLEHQEYLNRPLAEIRREFGIHVLN